MVAEISGKLSRDLERVSPKWSSVADSSPGSFWTRETETKTSLDKGDSASALPSSWEWDSGSCVPVRDILGCRELFGLLEDILVLLASLSANLKTGSCVNLGEVAGPSSKKIGLSISIKEGPSVVKEGGASVAMEEGPSVAKEDGAVVSTAGRALVARESETSVTKNGVSVVRKEEVLAFLESEASVTEEDGASVTK